jgi:cell envelope-related function transcriptional attenuator common domain
MNNFENETNHKNKLRPKRRKRRNPIARFFKIVISIVMAFVLISATVIFAYSKIASFGSDDVKQGSQMNIMDALIGKDISLNIAVFGVDGNEARTDVIFVIHFDSKSGNLNLLSVPRDTRVEISDEMYTYLKANDKYIPTDAICKINEVHAYAGEEKADEFSVKQLEDLLGIEIDHYIRINFDGFKNLVDLIGGVDFYVPQDMYWDMRDTGDPLIDLKEGMQHLDGEKAEQLVRFRRYVQGDVDRVKVQQSFIKEVIKKVLSTDTIVKNLPSLIKTAYEYIDTDIALTDAIKYMQYADDVDINKLNTETLPGVGGYVGNVSYFLSDELETKAAVKRLFFSDDVTESETQQSSKDKVIEVSNGGSKAGFAGENEEMLAAEGFNVAEISTYEGERTDYTRIVVSEDGIGEDLQGYYPNSQIVVDSDMLNEGIDIMIILGEDE